MQLLQKISTATASAVVGFAALNVIQEPTQAFGFGGDVLPPDTIVNGYSLTDAAREIALWQDTVNPAFLPNVPFQLLTSAASSYTVTPYTYLYLPIASVNDSPPILGTFPSTLSQAVSYFFDPSQIGANNITVSVNGKITPIGASYLAGPVSRPLPNGGNNTIVLAAFLAPFQPGEYTLNIKTNFNGALVGGPCSPSDCFSGDVTYQVSAVPEPTTMAGLALAGAGIGFLRRKKQEKTE